jgi:hypothetical protein
MHTAAASEAHILIQVVDMLPSAYVFKRRRVHPTFKSVPSTNITRRLRPIVSFSDKLAAQRLT